MSDKQPSPESPPVAAAPKTQYRNPASCHIPDEAFVSRMAKGFPWAAVGYRIILMMMKGEERVSSGGIVLPTVTGARGQDKEITTGIVIAFGPGEMTHWGFVSPEHDYGLILGDIVFIEPGTGVLIQDEENEYRVITPNEIVLVGRRDVGTETRNRLLRKAGEAIARYQMRPEQALQGAAPRGIPGMEPPDFEMGMEEAVELNRRARGKASKTMVLMDKRVSQEKATVRKE